MKTILAILSLLLITKVEHSYGFVDCQPEQIHLSFGETVSDYTVTWSTSNVTQESEVEYGIGNISLKATGTSTLFVDGGHLKRSQYIHRVTLKNLQPNTIYAYHCGSSCGWSGIFWFKTVPTGEDWSPSLAIYGDLGNENAQSLTRLQKDTQRGMYDAVLHVGDFAYNMEYLNGMVGDAFMKQIEPIAGYLPYMVCPGNHEPAYNFSNYRNRFSMPGDNENLWYSYNLGPVHFISISTELYFFMNYGVKIIANQYNWLENDLKEANKPENREKRPWIILYGHRPMYCRPLYHVECIDHEIHTRQGIPGIGYGLEDLLYNNGVDLAIWGHEHNYERLWPIYNFTVYNGTSEEPYKNAPAPIHLITGSAGNDEGRVVIDPNPPKYSAFQSRDFGYTRMKVHNKTHIYLEQVDDDMDGEIVDRFWIIREKHGDYPKRF